MAISEGDRLPEATFLRVGSEGPEPVELRAIVDGRKVVLFGIPGAFTPTCHTAHMPSFVRTAEQFFARDVDEIACIAVNDPFVLAAWSATTGAAAARIGVLADPEGAFTRAIGMDFDAPSAGLIGRSQRYAMVVEDRIVRRLNVETARGACEQTGGEALLESL